MSLLDKALQHHEPRTDTTTVDAGELELALAYLEGRITSKQLAFAIGNADSSNATGWAGTRLLRAVRGKQIKLVRIKDEQSDSERSDGAVCEGPRPSVGK